VSQIYVQGFSRLLMRVRTRRLVPKRVNKKELHRLSTIEDLQQLVLKADSVGVRMEEVQQLKVTMRSCDKPSLALMSVSSRRLAVLRRTS
jgi:hypothetical protein